MALTRDEASARGGAVDRLRPVVTGIWPGASVATHGSTPADLALPTSDVDCVITGLASPDKGGSPEGRRDSALEALAEDIRDSNFARHIQVYPSARVPIARYMDTVSRVNIDVCLGGGPDAGPTAGDVAGWLTALPDLRPLLIVLKAYLYKWRLEGGFKGGPGSHALLVMVAAFLVDWQGQGHYDALLAFIDVYGLRPEAVGNSLRAGEPIAFPEHNNSSWAGLHKDPRDVHVKLDPMFNQKRVWEAFSNFRSALTTPDCPWEAAGSSLLPRIFWAGDSVVGERVLPGLVGAAVAGAATPVALPGQEQRLHPE